MGRGLGREGEGEGELRSKSKAKQSTQLNACLCAVTCLRRMALCFVAVFILWDIKPVFYAVWSPFTWLMGYSDPRKPTQDLLHGAAPPSGLQAQPLPLPHPKLLHNHLLRPPARAEWYFRSSLDRYVWIYGMLCAFMHPPVRRRAGPRCTRGVWAACVDPHALGPPDMSHPRMPTFARAAQTAALLTRIDELPRAARAATRALVLATCGVIGYVYYVYVFSLPKVEYNKLHPYTSWIPITLWIVVRNMTPWLKIHAMRLYGWLGCITLETYICQVGPGERTHGVACLSAPRAEGGCSRRPCCSSTSG